MSNKNQIDFMSLLASGLVAEDSISSLGNKASASDSEVASAMLVMLPSMLGQMRENASTQEGAASLGKALDEHDLSNISAKDVVALIKEADEEDGVKILNHVYGNKEDAENVQAKIAESTGLTSEQIGTIMARIAPALLTVTSQVISGEAQKQQKEEEAVTTEKTVIQARTGKTAKSSQTTQTTVSKKPAVDSGTLTSLLGSLLPQTQKSSKSGGFDLDDLAGLAGRFLQGLGSGSSQNAKKEPESPIITMLKKKKLF